MKNNPGWFWLFFLGLIILLSPALKGGETLYTLAGLKLLTISGVMYYFWGRLKSGKILLATPSGNLILLALVVVLSASLLVSHYLFITIYWYTAFFCCVLLFYLALNLFSQDQDGALLRGLFWVLLAAGLVQAGLGIFEHFFRGQARAAGSFFNPAYYAGYLAGLISFPLAGAVFDLRPGLSGRKRTLLRLALAASALIIFFGILASASRAVVFLTIPLGLIFLVRFRYLGAVSLVVLGLALVFIQNPVRDRVQKINSDPYAWERVTIWKSSLKMIGHHPLGVGLGMYQYYYHRNMYPMSKVKIGRYGQEARQSHNEFLNFAAECSVLAPLLGLGFLGLILVRLLKGIRGRRLQGEDTVLLLAFGGSLLSILGHSLVDSNLHQPPVMAVAVLNLAAILAVSSRRIAGLVKTGEYDIPRPGFIRAYIIGAGVLISLLVIYQSAVEGIFFRALKIENPEQRVAKLYRLSRAPSGYAPLYFQLGEEFRKSFIYTDKTEFGIQSTKYYEFAAELNPEDYQTYFQWAETVYRLGVAIRTFKIFSESGDLCAKAAQLGPGQVFSYLLLSNIEYVKKDYRRSEHWLRTALGYEPYFLRARSRLAALLLEQENLDEGGREFQKLEGRLKEASDLLSRPDNGLSGYQKLLLATDPDELSAIEKKLRAQPIPPLFQESR